MFNRDWLFDPEFESWLTGLPEDDVGYCKLCCKEIRVCSGVSALRKHGKGVKHLELLAEWNRQRQFPKLSESVKSSHMSSSASGINFAFINMPSTSSATAFSPVVVNQNISNVSKKQKFNPRPKPPRDSALDAIEREFVYKSEDLLSRSHSYIEREVDKFLQSYKEALRERDVSSSQQNKRYRSVEAILDDYATKHENLRKGVYKRLVVELKKRASPVVHWE